MLKTVVVLPDGTELSSGVGQTNAIKSITIIECVNDGQELSLGSTCSNMVELTVISPNGGFSIAEGTEFTVYREDSEGNRHQVGLFSAEKPVRSSAHSLKVTAYDRITRLDKNLTDWVAGLTAWPYELFEFTQMVCTECGLEFLNTSIPNGTYLVERFSADGITGRQIIKWAAEIAGRFCRATPEGQIEFAWYIENNVAVGFRKPAAASVSVDQEGNLEIECDSIVLETDDDGNVSITGTGITATCDDDGNLEILLENQGAALAYYQGSLKYSDFQVSKIQKVQLKGSENDVGTVYPKNLAEDVNTYIISGNYLLTAAVVDEVAIVAETLYENLKNVTYTPCTVCVPTNLLIRAGDIIRITDSNGVTISAYVMSKKTSGQKDTLECTGSAHRESSSAVNEQRYASLHGKVLNLQMNVEGLRLENRDTGGKAASLALDVAGITSQVKNQETVLDSVTQNITELQQKAETFNVSIKSIQDNGVSKVETETGFTFSKDGLIISKSESEIENQLDETGMCVKRNGNVILQANNDGVTAVDVSVGNYLIVGDHARFEDYEGDRTACFWI